MEFIKHKNCKHCNIEKDISDFYKKNGKHSYWYYSSNCKSCTCLILKNYRKNNNDKMKEKDKTRSVSRKEYMKKYYEKNKFLE